MTDESPPIYEQLRDLAERIQRGDTDPQLPLDLAALHPADWADLVEELTPEESIILLRTLPLDVQADVIEYIEDEETAAIAEIMPVTEMAAILDEMAPDDAADLLGDINPHLAERLLERMDEDDAVRPLLGYDDDTAGGLMVPIPFRLYNSDTVAEAIQKLRAADEDAEIIYYLFVVDRSDHLVGIVGLRRLVRSKPERLIDEIMDSEVIHVHADTDQEECALILQRYGLLALPVVSEDHKLLGLITVDDLVDVVAEEAEEDTLLLGGLSSDSELFDSTQGAIRKRMPWLMVNLATAALAAVVVIFFEDTIAQFATLAALMGIVSGLGGNAGTQTLTLVVRGLATQLLSPRDALSMLRREWRVAALQGVFIGLTGALASFVVFREPLTSLVFACALIGNIVMAHTLGVLVPLMLERVGVDPAVASSIFVTACTDIFGFALLLGLATALFG
ncbi:MAG: magnesium transporter [Anaerolineales bacterium]|nr:magnesium transporter [Anaerolineales bacterium]MCB9128881.1 magnesium transporter [Ardenticatenales bacterium]MCB9172863.1 magnesium transporter [Ardenticatenales bacterium]